MSITRARVPIVTILAGLGFANICASNILFPLLPLLQEQLRLSATQLGAWMSIPALISLLLGPLAGRLADLRGRKFVMLGGLTTFALGGLACFFAPWAVLLTPYLWILLGRVLQNLGQVTTFPQYLAIAGEASPAGQRQAAMGTIETWTSVGGIVGPLIGTALFAFGLFAPFLAMVAILLVALVVVAWAVHPPPRAQAGVAGRSGLSTLGELGHGWRAYLGGFLIMGMMVAVQTFAGTMVRDALAGSRQVQSLTAALIPIAMVVGSLLVSMRQGTHRVGNRTVWLAAGTALAGLLLWTLSPTVVVAWAGLFAIGAGLGVWLPIVDEDISASSDDHTRGTRLSLLHGSKTTGVLVAPALVGGLIDRTGNYQLAFAVLLAASLIIVYLSLRGRGPEAELASGFAPQGRR